MHDLCKKRGQGKGRLHKKSSTLKTQHLTVVKSGGKEARRAVRPGNEGEISTYAPNNETKKTKQKEKKSWPSINKKITVNEKGGRERTVKQNRRRYPERCSGNPEGKKLSHFKTIRQGAVG